MGYALHLEMYGFLARKRQIYPGNLGKDELLSPVPLRYHDY